MNVMKKKSPWRRPPRKRRRRSVVAEIAPVFAASTKTTAIITLLLSLLCSSSLPSIVYGGDVATLSTPTFTSSTIELLQEEQSGGGDDDDNGSTTNTNETRTTTTTTTIINHSHRQNVCHRFDMYREGTIELRHALSGMALRPLMAKGGWFNYHNDDDDGGGGGIDSKNPGLLADLMDALASSANFTWRKSFGIMDEPETLNRTWTEMLMEGIENYDIAVNAWDQTVHRMELGASFIEPWFDGSIILIDQKDPPLISDKIDLLNWTAPFEGSVWALTIATILLSALVYQVIEYIQNERENRPLYQWFSDNLYMSSLNFTQNFEYAPNSVAGRIFGVSMAMWALVMTATYTANLASLFVQEHQPALVVDSIDQAAALEIPICTWGLTNSDVTIKEQYPNVIRVPLLTELDGYQALRRGDCGLVAAYKDNWLDYQGDKDYNPECDLEWVGRVVKPLRGGFAVKADAGHLCTSFIRDVLNVHMMEIISNGVFAELYEKHRDMKRDHDCSLGEAASSRRRRLGGSDHFSSLKRDDGHHRQLKGGGRGAAAAVGGAGGTNANAAMTLQQMMGTFALHWISMTIAILVSIMTTFYEKSKIKAGVESSVKRVINRCHGPMIGRPQKMNTSVKVQGMGHRQNGSRKLCIEDKEEGDRNDCYTDDTAPAAGYYSSERDLLQQQKQQELTAKVESLTLQMNTVLTVLHEIRTEQQHQKHQRWQMPPEAAHTTLSEGGATVPKGSLPFNTA